VLLYVFHLIVIIYSMIVLFIIYIFQFDEVPRYFKQVLNVDDAFLSSIGFEKFDKKDELVVRLLTPTTFLIVNILQIHYFNKPWLKLTDEKLMLASKILVPINNLFYSINFISFLELIRIF
jgi:hypothetical protein